jgi:hypothetical protein
VLHENVLRLDRGLRGPAGVWTSLQAARCVEWPPSLVGNVHDGEVAGQRPQVKEPPCIYSLQNLQRPVEPACKHQLGYEKAARGGALRRC